MSFFLPTLLIFSPTLLIFFSYLFFYLPDAQVDMFDSPCIQSKDCQYLVDRLDIYKMS